jgi:hypothetical protein
MAQVIWHIMGIMVAMGMPIPPGIMDGMLMGEAGIICIGAAAFMVTTRLDDQRYGEYNRMAGWGEMTLWNVAGLRRCGGGM